MNRTLSLRTRLTLIILVPLMSIALLVGVWQLSNARRTAAEVFDRSLLSAALAVANDVAISGGDALSERTRDILASTSGGQVFYHVYAPDGVIVAGYATPPVGIPRPQTEVSTPTTFDARYLGRAVHGVRLQNRTEIDGFAGVFTTTVWQDSTVRSDFVQDLVMRSLVTISALIASLGFIVWFGVKLGLRPLNDLEQAIERRSERELSPIQRAVPDEVGGIVSTLNRLLGQVSRSMSAQSEFIGNAAHQLRNPIAGVLALAEAVKNAPTAETQKRRAEDLLRAARDTADLSQKLLLLERAEAITPIAAHETIDLNTQLPIWVETLSQELPKEIELSLKITSPLPLLSGDATMLREAFVNLVDNAYKHGGNRLSKISVSAQNQEDRIRVDVSDNGKGLPSKDVPKALERFAQVSETSSSGLGLSIVAAIVKGHQGVLEISASDQGFKASLILPIQANSSDH